MKKLNNIYLSLDKELRKYDGYIEAKDLFKAKISSKQILELTKNGKIEKVSHGLYTKPNTIIDEYFVMQKRYPKIVFSFETSLYLHNLLNRAPFHTHITVPRGKKVNLKTIIHYQVIDKFNTGIIKIKTPLGNTVRCYNIEKTICDVMKHHSLDLETQNEMLNRYFALSNKNIDLLLEYAKKYNIYETINAVVERSLY